MILTKEEAIRRHRMMWEWIANETLLQKRCIDKLDAFEHFGWDSNRCISKCWCCEYSHESDEHGMCDYCPVVWPSQSEVLCCIDFNTPFYGNGLYDLWNKYSIRKKWRTAAYYAMYISMLPERKD